MSTLKDENSEVDIIQSVTPAPVTSKRGPTFTSLPYDLIKQLAGEGLGSKAIAAELAKQGQIVSYKTIQRRLQGVML
jgi:hypothetical protein